MAFDDTIREGSFDLIKKLKYKGVSDIWIVSGDNQSKAADVGRRLGIGSVYGN